MAVTSFDYFPTGLFYRRVFRPAILVFFLAFVLMGVLSGIPLLQPYGRGVVDLPPLQMAQFQYSDFFYQVGNMPERCISGTSINEVQKEKCAERWVRILVTTFWVLFPFLMTALCIRVSYRYVRRCYRIASFAIQKGAGLSVGTVTDPAEALGDFYGWLHCSRSITVQFADRKQMHVYVPVEAVRPAPGQQMVVVPMGKRLGKDRFHGILYTPHVAVVTG